MWTRLLLILTLVLATTASVKVKLKGGLIYKNEGTAQINQGTLQFKRFLDVKALYSVAQKLQDTTSMHQTYCDIVSDKYKESKSPQASELSDMEYYAKMKNLSVVYISTTLKYPLVETQSVCARLNARPVEIRDIYTYNAALSYANERNIQQILAGIIWSPKNGRFEFMTDHTPAKIDKLFPQISYGGSYKGSDHLANWDKDSYLVADAPSYPLIYKNPASTFKLRLADNNEKMANDLVMCEKDFALRTNQKSEVKNMFMAVANHACLRDSHSLQMQTKYTLNEIKAITTLSFNYSQNTDWTQYYPEFEPLNKKDEMTTFWFNRDPTNRTKRSVFPHRPLYWNLHDDVTTQNPTRKVTNKPSEWFSPYADEFKQMSTPYDIFHPQVYQAPKGFWTSSSMVRKMPYEDMQIITEVPSTIPDYIILLHSIWKIEIEKQYHSKSFESWMEDQAKRVKLYSLLRRFPLIKKVEQNLQAALDNEELLQQTFRHSRSLPPQFLERIVRNINQMEQESDDDYHTWNQESEFSYTSDDEKSLNPDDLQQILQEMEEQDFRQSEKPPLTPTGDKWLDLANKLTPITHHSVKGNNRLRRDLRRIRRLAPLLAIASAASAGAAGGAAGYAISQALGQSGPSGGLSQNEIAIMKRHAIELGNLQIDSKQHTAIINNLTYRLQFFETQIIGNFEGTLAMTIGIDLKSIITQLQTITQVTVLKYNSALLAAASGKTSPYVLSQDELEEIVQTTQRDKAITLTSDLTLIKTVPALVDRQIIFFFDIPIIDANKEFTIYTIAPLPIFLENGTYLPNLDSDHIAIHSRGDKFTTLTDLQLTGCLDKPPRCVSNTAITPIQNGMSCVALAYIKDSQMCPLTLTTMASIPQFYFYDEQMFYSTPSETKVYMICKPPPGQLARPDTTLTLTGYGQFELLPGCTLTMPDGTTHHTPNRPTNATLYDKALFMEITQLSMPKREKVVIDNSPSFNTLQRATYTVTDDEDVGSFTNRMIKSLDPAKVTANTGVTVAIVLLLIALACLLYFCHYKRLCEKCCKKPKSFESSLDITPPKFNLEPVHTHWFRDDDQGEPDTISSIAARAPPSRHASFSNPFRTLPSAFPAWFMGSQPIPQAPTLRTSTQMSSADIEAMNSYQEEMARQQIMGLQGSNPDSQQIRPPIYRPSPHEKTVAEQQRLLEQHKQNEPKVSFSKETNSVTIH